MFKDLEPHATHQLTKKPFFRQCDLCGKTTNNEEIEAACTVSPAARIAELEAALQPFADIDGEGDADYSDGASVTLHFGRSTYYGLSLGDLRRARRAMNNTTR